jgi:hypothetical protein
VPDGPLATVYRDVAAKVLEQLKGPSRSPPKFVIEE